MAGVVIETATVAATEALGRLLGETVSAGALLLLYGELGAGKTCLVRGVAAGLGVDKAVPITSPTYTLMNSYSGRLPLYHFDLYRLGDADELAELGFEEYFYGDGVAVVEWPQRGGDFAAAVLEVLITVVDEKRRRIEIRTTASGYATVMAALRRFGGGVS